MAFQSPVLVEPLALTFVVVLVVGLILAHVFAYWDHHSKLAVSCANTIETYLTFCWNCFFKPHTKAQGRGQQDALENFYQAQASVYDATRAHLLKGREDMLGLVAAQLKHRVDTGELPEKPTWVDIGGGTGYNIEVMSRFLDVPEFFGAVYLVDLSTSLCRVAEERFKRLGWKNVKVICEDARTFNLEDYEVDSDVFDTDSPATEKPSMQSAELITMSYALSMIPEFYPVVDALSSLLTPNGVIGVADFYVQSEVDYKARNYTGGEIDRHCMWISRVFWRTWFEADRVSLEAARRDYLEYRFGTILGFNARCHLVGLRIPYYVWIGCSKTSGALQSKLTELNAAVTESPFLSALDKQNKAAQNAEMSGATEIRSKAYESAIVNLASSLPLPSSWYQTHHWRIYYDDQLEKHKQFNDDYLYAFTWEDAQVDTRLLKIKEDDVILAITSAGDNILSYALEKPKRIHAVDLNPTQNHLLELKVAAFTALPYEDVWKLFGDGTHADFRSLLINKLSPHMSSLAFQYWLQNGTRAFSNSGFYFTGGSRHALSLTRWIFRLLGLSEQVKQLCSAETLNEQREIWQRSIRRVILSKLLSWTIIGNERWLWRALGVPVAQRQMIEQDYLQQRERQEPALTSGQTLRPSHSRTSSTSSTRSAASADSFASLASMANAQAASSSTHTSAAESTTPVSHLSSGHAIWSYVVSTLDPVALHTHLRTSNHYYLLCLLGHYTRACCPSYLTARAHSKLSRADAFSGLRIHTDEVGEVVERMQPNTLTIAVVMDSMDWFDPGASEAEEQVAKLRRALKSGGRVLLRSSGANPWYIGAFERQGFNCKRVNVREDWLGARARPVDRVNMYKSTWICTKVTASRPGSPVVERKRPVSGGAVGDGRLDDISIGEPGMQE